MPSDADHGDLESETVADVAARPGQLTPGWQIAVTLVWVATLVALAAVWNTSRQLGLSTWWLGPPAQPRPVWMTLAPFVPPAVVAVLALTGRRYVAWAGLVAAACIAAVGLGDLGRVTGLGVVELLIAAAGAMASIAAFSGTYRTAHTDDD
jgi:hypothetical protein